MSELRCCLDIQIDRGVQCIINCLLIIAITATLGCGPKGVSKASGTITVDGAPLKSGEIQFVPAKGFKGSIAGAIIEAGTYEIPAVEQGVRVGNEYVVQITSMVPSGTLVVDPNEPGGKREALENVIPAKYNEASELSVLITPGANVHNFDLLSR